MRAPFVDSALRVVCNFTIMESEFWTSETRYGVVHRPAEEPGLLLVFVHGLFGDARLTWGSMPEWVCRSAGHDPTVASFFYPSKVWERASITASAGDLRTWLETEFADHQHVIFVTHSTGGLVVKAMLDDAHRLIEEQTTRGEFDYGQSNSIWLRTRRLIYIAVPHSGGAPSTIQVANAAYRIAYPIMAPVLRLVRYATQGGKDWGKNEIIPALRWQNPELLRLEESFIEQQKRALNSGFSVPVTHDIHAKSDLAVPVSAVADERDIYFRGTHGSVKVPAQPDDPIVGIVSDFVARYSGIKELTLTDLTLKRIAEVNAITGTSTLIKTDGVEPASHPSQTVSGATAGSQEQVCAQVVSSVYQGAERPQQVVVTGDAGVGKSAVLRMIAWRLSNAYLANPDRRQPLPLILPLQQISVAELREEDYSWDTLWAWWDDWARTLYPNLGCNLEWLEEVFRHRAVVVVLDGLDDFLTNHGTLGLSLVVRMLDDTMRRYAPNTRFTIVIGVRSSVPGLEKLVRERRDIFEILRLSEKQAANLFPSCDRWLRYVRDQGLLDLVLTPLILSNFEPDCEFSEDTEFSRSSILQQTIETVIRRSNLTSMRLPGGETVGVEPLLDALAIIGWLIFVKARGEVHSQDLANEAAALRAEWERHFEAMGRPLDENFGTACRLIQNQDTLDTLLQRTIFIPTGPNRVRCSHRSWQEFLVSRYFFRCVKSGNLSDLRSVAFYSEIYRLTGELLATQTLSQEHIATAIEQWRKTDIGYVVGNLAALLAWSRVGIEPRALDLLLDAVQEPGAVWRMILIGGLGYRVLVDAPGDAALAGIRRGFFPVLCDFADPVRAPVDDPVVTSMAWCYQKAFSARFGMQAPAVPWPALNFEPETTVKALPAVCTMEAGNPVLDDRSRSRQIACLTPIHESYRNHDVVVRGVHYLYYLTAAACHSVHIFEVAEELPQILAEGSKFEEAVRGYTQVPELLQVYLSCRVAHHALDPGNIARGIA